MSKVAIYPGTFDPITFGHIDVIKKSLKLFDKIIVAVSDGENKRYLFDIDERIEIGKGRLILEGKKVAIINFGARLNECLLANEMLNKKGIGITLVDARFAKPLDENLIWEIATNHEAIITIEEGSLGGFGSHVSQFLSEKNLLDNNLKFRSMILPDKFIDHNKPEIMYKEAGLDAEAIVSKVFDVLNSKVILQKQN